MSKIIDNKSEKELLKKLGELGLSEKESLVYIALLPHEGLGSGKIIQATGLHGQFVYTALEKLESLGLAKHTVQNGRKKFSAGNPKRLLSFVEEKRLLAQSVASDLQARFAGAHEQDFEVYQGESAFMMHQLEQLRLLPKGSEILVIATQTEQYMATFETYGMAEEYERIRKERNISIRYIGAEEQRKRLETMNAARELWTYNILPGLGLGSMSIEIHPTAVNFVMYGSPLLDFSLTSKEAAEGYRQFFEAIWALAGK